MADLVTRADLKAFDQHAQELILWAQKKGARVRVSNRHHAILRFRDRSASVPRQMKLQTRTAQNARAQVRRLFRKSADVEPGKRSQD